MTKCFEKCDVIADDLLDKMSIFVQGSENGSQNVLDQDVANRQIEILCSLLDPKLDRGICADHRDVLIYFTPIVQSQKNTFFCTRLMR